MTEVVLDASALLALLKGEPGADKVAEVLTYSHMGVFNFAEVASHFFRRGMTDSEVDAILRPLPILLAPADADLAWDAARLRSLTADAGLSLGDRFCLALARREKLPVWTGDRIWGTLAGAVGVDVTVIR